MAQIKKVTMQDIADACGLSRNTVSKIFNNRGNVPDTTKNYVISTAQKMGYLMVADTDTPLQDSYAQKSIALLTHSQPMKHNFGIQFITNFTNNMCREGFNLKIFEVSDEEIMSKSLPTQFDRETILGIVLLELFDREYTHMLCDIGIPMIMVDSYTRAPGDIMKCDIIFMENYASSIALTNRMIAAGARKIGFVGDINYCSSFLERWNGYRSALNTANLTFDRDVCILADNSQPYGEVEWVASQLDSMPYIPDGFVCANDFIAIRVMHALQRRGICIPDDVMISGFDGSPEAEVVSPSLTTAVIPGADIGRLSAFILLQRIKHVDFPNHATFVKTDPVFRDSVR